MEYDIIFVMGEIFFDHPLCGVAILKRLLEGRGYSVGVIEMPRMGNDVAALGKPKLFFGVTSGSIDSMVRNYTPMKRLRKDDQNLNYNESVPDRAVIVYTNWIKRRFKDVPVVLGGTEATLRRFTHYDYWGNCLRKSVLLDSGADALAYGCAEKQVLEIADRLKGGKPLDGVPGTCVLGRDVPEGFSLLPSHEEVSASAEKFCEMQNMFSNHRDLAQRFGGGCVIQYKSPDYTPADLDEYYSQPFTRAIPAKHLRGFEFSVVTHRGCIGECNFCSLKLTQGNRIVSRSEESILKEIEAITRLKYFKGNIDDLGGPSANMYGMDCGKCRDGSCLDCPRLDRSGKRATELLRKARQIRGVKNVFVKSGIRYDLATPEYIREIALHHVFDTLRIAPEHVSRKVLKLMNKDRGDLMGFVRQFRATGTEKGISFYMMTGHPGSSMKEARELADAMARMENVESVQLFTPTPMTVSTCMYHTGMDPKTGEKVHVPYTYREKKVEKTMALQAIKREGAPKPGPDRNRFRRLGRRPKRRKSNL